MLGHLAFDSQIFTIIFDPMEYGRMPLNEIEKVDFTLPADSRFNGLILKGKLPSSKIYMGTNKWGRKEWIGKLYPIGTKDAEFLTQYLKHYNAIELNATHYKIHTPEVITKWAAKAAGKDFKFSPKVTNSISHYSSFSNVDLLTTAFLEGILVFGENLGPIFLQVSEKYSPKQRDKVFAYLKTLPTDLQFFLEVRHPEWFSDKVVRKELFDTLRALKVGAIITDTLPHREVVHMELTVPKCFIRFMCQGDHYSDIARIDAWAKRLKEWQEKGLEECYFFVHVLNDALTPEITKYVAHQFNTVCNAGLPEVKFIQPGLF